MVEHYVVAVEQHFGQALELAEAAAELDPLRSKAGAQGGALSRTGLLDGGHFLPPNGKIVVLTSGLENSLFFLRHRHCG